MMNKTRCPELETKPRAAESMERIGAWFHGEIIDRAPVKFTVRNPSGAAVRTREWGSLKERWFDAEYQVESFLSSISGKRFLAETFPVFCPNLGPGVYSAFYGGNLTFGETTSWTDHFIKNYAQIDSLRLDRDNEYYKKINEITDCALAACEGQFIVGYTDLHPSLDCAADWRGAERLCFDLYDDLSGVKKAVDKAVADFGVIFSEYDLKLKTHNQPSVNWMGIPSFCKMHVPSCDFSYMISREMFREVCLPAVLREVKSAVHNIWHLDGRGCARHLDDLLEIKEIQAIQWVQGAGEGEPIMQWIDLIKKIQSKGKSAAVYLRDTELDAFIGAVLPKGIFLCVDTETEESHEDILKTVNKWSMRK
jgi:hypothetical protein